MAIASARGGACHCLRCNRGEFLLLSLARRVTWTMIRPSSLAPQVAGSPGLALSLIQKRRHSSLSSDSSSSTVKVASGRKPPRISSTTRPAAQTFPDKIKPRKKKRRSRLTGLTDPFYIESRTVRRSAESLLGGSSGGTNIKEQDSQAISASDMPTSSCDSEACCFWMFCIESHYFRRVMMNALNKSWIPVCLRLFLVRQVYQRSYAMSRCVVLLE